MARDYFAVLGLRPDCYSPQIIARCFQAERTRLLRHLHDPLRYSLTRRHLEELHLAYATLRDPDRQDEYRQHLVDVPEPVRELRALIRASLEDGLLRHSRRQDILAHARQLGFNDFQAHLLIAQVQCGDERTPVVTTAVPPRQHDGNGRGWARLAGVGMLAVTMFVVLVRMLGAS
jgi:hypothetical protein